MKKIIITLIAGIIPAILSLSGAYAQGKSRLFNIKLQPSAETAVKAENSPPASLSNINSKAIKNFKKEFNTVTDESWTLVSDGFIAKFNLNGIKTRVDYDKKGHWLHTIKTYDEKKLPRDIRAMVKSNYYDYTINQVQEIEFPNHLVYLVYLEDENGFKNIRVLDGEMDVMQEFKK